MLSIPLIKVEQNCFEVKRIADDMIQQVDSVKSSYKIIQVNRNLKSAQLTPDQMSNIYLEFQQKLSQLECMMNQIMGLKDVFIYNINQLFELEHTNNNYNNNNNNNNNNLSHLNNSRVHIEYVLQSDQLQPQMAQMGNYSAIKIEEPEIPEIYQSSNQSSSTKNKNNQILSEQLDKKDEFENSNLYVQVDHINDESLYEKDIKMPTIPYSENPDKEQYHSLNLANKKIIKKPQIDDDYGLFAETSQNEKKNIYKYHLPVQKKEYTLSYSKNNKSFNEIIDYLQKERNIDWKKVYHTWRQFESKSKMKIPSYFYTSDFRNNLKIKGVTQNLTKQEILDLFEMSKLFRSQSAFSKFLQLSRDQMGKMFRRKLGIRFVQQKSIYMCDK